MLQEGLIHPDDFVEVVSANWEQTLMPSLVSADNITSFFDEYDSWQASGQTVPGSVDYIDRVDYVGANLYRRC